MSVLDRAAVTFKPSGRTIYVEVGTVAISAAQMADEAIDAVCGGKGRCGKCKVRVFGFVSDITEEEKKFFSADELANGWRMACRVKILGAVTIDIPKTVSEGHKILSDGFSDYIALDSTISKVYAEISKPTLEDQTADLERIRRAVGFGPIESLDVMQTIPDSVRSQDFRVTSVLRGNELIAVEPGDTRQNTYGVAFDIGTTTVVGFLIDLDSGKELAVASQMNAQAVYGADVVSRINYSMENSQGLQHLQEKIAGVLDQIIDELAQNADISRTNIYEITVVGNTCMQHLFLGLDPKNLAQAPYVSVVQDEVVVRAKDLGLEIAPGGYVTVLPSIAGFVGGDTVGVLLATSIDESPTIKLVVDIGTNGEIALGSRSNLVSCSTAAGPAFEGAQISHGMRGTTGAIEAVSFGEDVQYKVIGDVCPRGICGSGLIDIVAELVKCQILDQTGRILGPLECPQSLSPKLRERIVEGENGYEFIIAYQCDGISNKPITVTQRDIRELQLAKGAISAGIEVLKDELGIEDVDISEVLLAGAFGNYIKRESAAAIGLIPSVPLERVRSVGNAAGVGSKMALLSLQQRQRARMVARSVKYVELSSLSKFQEKFMMSMYF